MLSHDPKGSTFCAILTCLLCVSAALAEPVADELRVKGEGPFEFAQKPTVTRDGDRVTIEFETKALCDVTVAIEDEKGKIVRHFASGVLGPNAPTPLQKNSRKQRIVWDGKDDQGAYVEDFDKVTVRVSLGLKARFDRQFLWSPHRRFTLRPPSFCAQPEGIYVCDGRMTDFIYLFDHRGNYVRTVYPFPAHNLDKLVGVRTRVFEQSGKRLPWKSGYLRSSLLTCGGNVRFPTSMEQLFFGAANSAMAIRNGQIALAYYSLNTLATDGTTGGLPLEGPETHVQKSKRECYYPRSVALSPDGKTAYVTGFYVIKGIGAAVSTYWVHGVGRVDVANGKRGDPMEAFTGVLNTGRQAGGSKPSQFKTPSSVDCDPQGRVYVTDHFNDRLQVFDPKGTHLKDIPVNKPAEVCIDPRTGEIYVFSWALDSAYFRKGGSDGYGRGSKVKPTLTHLAPFDDPRVLGTYSFPIMDTTLGGGRHGGTQYRAIVDHWAPGDAKPVVWLISGVGGTYRGASHRQGALQRLQKKEGADRLEVVYDFTRRAARDVPLLKSFYKDRLSANPKTGELYVPRSSLVINPETGRVRKIRFPQAFKEMAFDMDGRAYLSTAQVVSRFDVMPGDKWREVPFDYGVQIGRRVGALKTLGGPFHSGGVSVSPKGHVLVAVVYGHVESTIAAENRRRSKDDMPDLAERWKPTLYKGRGGILVIRVWDKYGKILYDDAVKGLGYTHNVFMDKDDNLYVASGAVREGYSDVNTGTLVKIRPDSKVFSDASPLPLEPKPARPPDTRLGGIGKKAWWEGAEWFYGGIGFNGKNHGGVHACHCSQFRIAQDYYARTFVPETVHFTVAVLDSAGNVMMRIGQYGNIDDGVPLVPDPRIPKPRPLGGDELALFHPAYLAVHTDRRLFINDPGNDRIVSVRLDYHATERVALKDVEDRG